MYSNVPWVVIGLCAIACSSVGSRSAKAQYAAALQVGVTSRASHTVPLVVAPRNSSHDALVKAMSAESERSRAFVQPVERPKRIWYWFTIGGAIAGAGTMVSTAALHCDQDCQDDGGWAYVPYYATGAALLGAGTGTVFGLLVDAARRGAVAAHNR